MWPVTRLLTVDGLYANFAATNEQQSGTGQHAKGVRHEEKLQSIAKHPYGLTTLWNRKYMEPI